MRLGWGAKRDTPLHCSNPLSSKAAYYVQNSVLDLENSKKKKQSGHSVHYKLTVTPYGKVQNMDPWSMDPLHGPGPWTGSMKIWTGSMDPFHGPGPWTPYFYYPY